MADHDVTIPIPLSLPRDEAVALAQFCKRIDHDTVADFASPTFTYGSCEAGNRPKSWLVKNLRIPVRLERELSFCDVVLTRNKDRRLIREGGPDRDFAAGKTRRLVKRFACAAMLSAMFRLKKIAS